MGRLKLQAGINAIEEEPEDCDATYSNKATVACMINSEIGSVLAVMRRNVRWGGRFMSGDDQLEHSLSKSFHGSISGILSTLPCTYSHFWM